MKKIFLFFIFLFQVTISWAIGPYVNNGVTVNDQGTGLTWQQETADINNDGSITSEAYPNGDVAAWEDALSYCENLFFSEETDWRLPNIRELRSIADYSRYQPAIDPVFQCESSIYCSSTTGQPGYTYTNRRAGIDFEFGGRTTSPGYVRCVRGGISPVTSQPNEIVYASRKDGNQEIYSMSLTGSNNKNLTNSSSSTDGTPSYSPDQKNIVFASDRTGNFDLYIMPAEGSSSPVNITNNPNDDGWPAWSPKGDKILFLSNRDDDKVNHNIYTTDTAGENVSRITFGYNIAHAVWSPDATRIAFASNREICIVQLSTGIVTQLTTNSYYDDYPSWSPDGKYIVYASAKISGNDNKLDMFIIDISSKAIKTIMEKEFDIRYPAWLPDGRIVFTMANEYGEGENQNSSREIYITKNKVQFSSTLTEDDITRLTFNDVEDNHPSVAMPTRKIVVPCIIAPMLLNN